MIIQTDYKQPKKKYTIYEMPFEILTTIFWPKSSILIDQKNNSVDDIKHPVFFFTYDFNQVTNEYTYYGIRLTSHPKSNTKLDDLFFVPIKNSDVVIDKCKERENSFLHCENIDVFITSGDIYINFEQHGAFIDEERLKEIMSDVLVRHVLLQENHLAVPDENTELLLILFNVTKEEIMNSERYKDYQQIIDSTIYRKAVQRKREEICAICASRHIKF